MDYEQNSYVHFDVFYSMGLLSFEPYAKFLTLFPSDPIDVVIPCLEKDLDTLPLCIRGIRENCAGIRKIIVVSEKQLTDAADWFNEAKYPFNKKKSAGF